LIFKNKIFHFFKYRLIFGLENGLVVIDYLSKFILMNMATGDLYGTSDPFQRAALSPKRRGPSNDSNNDDSNSFSYEYQVNYPKILFFFLNVVILSDKKIRIHISSSIDH
jgi:hypothetical protein